MEVKTYDFFKWIYRNCFYLPLFDYSIKQWFSNCSLVIQTMYMKHFTAVPFLSCLWFAFSSWGPLFKISFIKGSPNQKGLRTSSMWSRCQQSEGHRRHGKRKIQDNGCSLHYTGSSTLGMRTQSIQLGGFEFRLYVPVNLSKHYN